MASGGWVCALPQMPPDSYKGRPRSYISERDEGAVSHTYKQPVLFLQATHL